MIKGNIWLVERNIRGAYVIYGAIGVKQYYGYTKAEVTECELDERAHIGFFDTHEEASKAAIDFRRFCSGYPCGLITCAIFDVEIEDKQILLL